MPWGAPHPPGCRPPWEIASPRAGAPLGAYIKEGGREGSSTLSLGASLPCYTSSSSHSCLAKPCWSTTLLHHHHAVVLLLDGVYPNLSFSPCWIKA